MAPRGSLPRLKTGPCHVVGDERVARQQKRRSRRDCHRPDAEVARSVPVISAQRAKRFCLSARYADAWAPQQ
jgi:hypothetical protein